MQVGESSRSLTQDFQAIDRAVTNGIDKTIEASRFGRAAVAVKKRNDATQRAFDSRDRSATIASAMAGNMSRRLG